MMIKYLLILGIGHLLGDFYFQNDKIARSKDKKFKAVVLHALEYYLAFLFTILPVFSLELVLAATGASIVHFVIDSIKYLLLVNKKIKKSGNVFLIDQCVHIVSILGLAYIMNLWNCSIRELQCVSDLSAAFHYHTETLGRWILSVLLIHIPANIFIQNFIGEYKPKTDATIISADHKAGRKIGTIERLIMLIFLSKDQFAALGFVLTAKSIARYDKIVKDEKFAEYYLLGTLVSTLCVVLCKVLILA